MSREFAILGPFRSRQGGAWQEAPSPQAARVGAALAAFPGQTLSVPRIVSSVWGDRPPPTAASALRVYVSQLRRQWGDESIVVSRDGYQLETTSEQVDAHRFLALVGRAKEMARRLHLKRAEELWNESLELWRGELSNETTDVELSAFRTLLSEVRVNAEYERTRASLELAVDGIALADVIAEAQRQAVRFKDRELPQLLLARALCLGGRRVEAFAALDAFVERSGLPESPALTALRGRMERQDEALAPMVTRAVSNIDSSRGYEQESVKLIDEVRAALVDRGAHVVRVVVSDPAEQARQLASLAGGLSADFPGGRVRLVAGQGSLAAADDVVHSSSRGRRRSVTSLDEPSSLLVLLQSDDAVEVGTLVRELAALMHAPRLVVVSSHAVGVPDEFTFRSV